jgi:Holliday junction resolvase RusA-like endonuclease
VYTPAKQIEYENWVRLCYQEAYPNEKPMEGPIIAHVDVYMRVPKSASKKKREAMLAGEIKPTKKPDLDNCVKQLDALNGVAFADDSQIVEILARKIFAEEDSMSITLTEL